MGGRDKTLLVVDDHEATLEVMGELLRSDGYRVLTASTVAEGAELAEREPVDLVLSDLTLSDGTGLELMQKLRRDHDVPGVAITGERADEKLTAAVREAGFVGLLTKPIDYQELRQLIAVVAEDGGEPKVR